MQLEFKHNYRQDTMKMLLAFQNYAGCCHCVGEHDTGRMCVQAGTCDGSTISCML